MLKIYNTIRHPRINFMRLTAIFWHLRLLRKLYLSPEATSGKDMKPLIDAALDNNHPVLHMYLHSSSLIYGPAGFIKNDAAMDIIKENIQQAVEYACSKTNIKFCTITEAAVLLKNRAS